jgi:hypothetical protein
MTLRPCPGCRRHVAIGELACPFCAHALPAGAPPPPRRVLGRVSRAAVFGAALAACDQPPAPSTPPSTPPAPAPGSAADLAELEQLLDGDPAGRSRPSATPVDAGSVDAAVLLLAAPDDAAMPDAAPSDAERKRLAAEHERRRELSKRAHEAARRMREEELRRQKEEEVRKQVEMRHMPKPYGAPPARRRVV